MNYHCVYPRSRYIVYPTYVSPYALFTFFVGISKFPIKNKALQIQGEKSTFFDIGTEIKAKTEPKKYVAKIPSTTGLVDVHIHHPGLGVLVHPFEKYSDFEFTNLEENKFPILFQKPDIVLFDSFWLSVKRFIIPSVSILKNLSEKIIKPRITFTEDFLKAYQEVITNYIEG